MNHLSRWSESDPALTAGWIIKDCSRRGWTLDLVQIQNDVTQSSGAFAYRAEIRVGRQTYFGHSWAFDSKSREIAVIEAYERTMFREVLQKDLLHSKQSWFNLSDHTQVELDSRLAIGAPGSALHTSSGMAVHHDLRSALSHALLEVAERDIILRHWLSQIAPQELNSSQATEFELSVADQMQKVGFSLRLFQHLPLEPALEGLAVVTAVLQNRSNHLLPFLLVGAGAGWRLTNARDKAIRECAQLAFTDLPWIRAHQKLPDSSVMNQCKRQYDPAIGRETLRFFESGGDAEPRAQVSIEPKALIDYYQFKVLPIIGEEAVSVVRVWSERAVPMFFGPKPAIFAGQNSELHPY